jgi:stage II sporulation protein P
MDRKKRSTVFGAALIILCLLVLAVGRLRPDWEGPLLRLPQGGLSRPSQGQQTVPAGPAADQLTFTPADGARVSLRYGDNCNYRPDVQALLLQPLQWQLREADPTVLIIHTHGSESYTRQPGQDYAPSGDYRTLDTDHNMIALGDYLTSLLEAAGIRVIHDRSIHDYPSYNSSYENSRLAAQDFLRQHPSIRLVLDLHRDAVLLNDGSQFAPMVTAAGEQVARLMLVVGTDGSGMYHPLWRENLATALKLQALLERQVPGITRPTILRAQRFNHDLSPGAMIVEIGATGNTLQQAMAAVPYLADAIIALSAGATADSAT